MSPWTEGDPGHERPSCYAKEERFHSTAGGKPLNTLGRGVTWQIYILEKNYDNRFR